MKIVIDDKVCDKLGLPYTHLLLLLFIKTGAELREVLDDMYDREMIVDKEDLLGKSTYITQRWNDVCSNVLLTSDDSVPDDERVVNLARQLMALFPKGKKPGTTLFWKGNAKDNSLKLKKFFKLYGNKYSDEDIIDATKRYLKTHEVNNYAFMRVLKYFIWKDEKKVNEDGVGYIEEHSDLATFLENKDNESFERDWTTSLR